MKKKVAVLSIALLLTASMAHAHSVWINAFESHAHGGHNAMISLGWGHALPMDDHSHLAQRPHRHRAI